MILEVGVFQQNRPGPDLESAQIYLRRAAAYHRKADVIQVEISAMLRTGVGQERKSVAVTKLRTISD